MKSFRQTEWYNFIKTVIFTMVRIESDIEPDVFIWTLNKNSTICELKNLDPIYEMNDHFITYSTCNHGVPPHSGSLRLAMLDRTTLVHPTG